MANDRGHPSWEALDQAIPMTLIQYNVGSFSNVDINPTFGTGVFVALAVDASWIGTTLSGYIQFVDTRSGNTIWVDEMDATLNSYASWRGFYAYEFGVSGSGTLEIQNHTTGSVGVHLSGLYYRGTGVTSIITNTAPLPV